MAQLTYADAVDTSGVCWAWQLEPLLTLASAVLGVGQRVTCCSWPRRDQRGRNWSGGEAALRNNAEQIPEVCEHKHNGSGINCRIELIFMHQLLL